MKNERGLITVDFLFSIVLILGFSGLMFVTCMTLSMASVTQYVTYAAARNYFAAHLDATSQSGQALAKYTELANNPTFKPLYTNGWYSIDAEPTVGDHTKVIPEYEAATQGVNKFWGAGTSFTAHILDFHIPFFGSTNPDGDGTGSGFKTYIGSYMGREPSTAECVEFTQKRWDAIRKLAVSGGSSYGTGTGTAKYYTQTDDGC